MTKVHVRFLVYRCINTLMVQLGLNDNIFRIAAEEIENSEDKAEEYEIIVLNIGEDMKDIVEL